MKSLHKKIFFSLVFCQIPVILLPGLRDIFSDDEKNGFTTKQENVSQDQVEQELANQCFNGDKTQAQKAFQEGKKLLTEETGQQGRGIIEGLFGNSDKRQV